MRYPSHFTHFDRKIYTYKSRYACQHADAVVAISESTKRDIVAFFGTKVEKIHVIYQNCDESFYHRVDNEIKEQIRLHYNLPEQFLLYVGAIIERKNLLPLIKSLSLFDDIPLVVIGNGTGHYIKKVNKAVKKHNLTPRVQFIKAEFADFPVIYQLAKVLIYPSQYEGFGIPVLEGLASGTPVITSSKSSLPEAGGPQPIYLDEITPKSIATAIQHVLSNEQDALQRIKAGKQFAKRFNKKLLTEQLINLYNTL